ncbi:MAG TPA: metal ABC transporter permease [Miltoncostaeaceae bacterium]|nr:metal ABC transporter permease [Miltoncostaeaceae bacterium]
MGGLIGLIPLPYPDAVVALGAALLGITAGVVGCLAVLSQRSLVGDALAHSALPGVAVAFIATGAKDPAALLAGAACAGLVGAVLIVGIERGTRLPPDAAIGVVLSVFFSLGIVLLTHLAHDAGAEQAGLERYLFGQAAGLLERDVQVMAVLAAVALAVVAAGLRPITALLFDRGFAAVSGLPVRVLELLVTALLVVAIVIGLRTVGAILMVAMLIAPCAAARQLTDRMPVLLVLAGLTGAVVGVVGALAAARGQAPAGPVIVLVASAAVALAVLGAPGRGVLWTARRTVRARRRQRAEGVLVDLETAMHAGAPPTAAELAAVSGRPPAQVRGGLADLAGSGRARADADGRWRLTETGAAAAHAALESRTLWAAWLEHGAHLGLPDAREPDPRDVRGSLGDVAADRLMALAGGGRR